jgi:hypothetical protein
VPRRSTDFADRKGSALGACQGARQKRRRSVLVFGCNNGHLLPTLLSFEDGETI